MNKKSTYSGYTTAHKRANEKYLQSQEEIKLRVSKGKKEEIKAAADSEGKSLNKYILEAVEQKMNPTD